MEDKQEQVKQLKAEIKEIINVFQKMGDFFISQETVSHLNQSKVQWQGGIFGAIREMKEEKRLVKILNTPIYNGQSYYQLSSYIINQTNEMVDKQLTIQSLLSKEDAYYYDGVVEIFQSVVTIIKAWYDYAPDIARAGITIGDEKDVALLPTVEAWTKEAIKKLDLPEGLVIHEDKSSEGGSGCLGVILLFIACSSCMVAFI